MSQNIFFEIHKDIPREGPGNNESTRKAYEMLTDLPKQPNILDVGCGPGMQTIELAHISGGTITAVDTHQPFLEELARRAMQAGLQDKISPQRAAMQSMSFPAESFDLIWSEGAIYIMGFARGLREWRPFLKNDGYLVVSEITWLQPDPPVEIARFWGENYPAMQTVEGNLSLIREAGYDPIGHFILPEAGWWEYYLPLEQRIASLREQYSDSAETLQQLAEEQREIDLYRQYAAYYSYVFYLMQAR